MNMGKILAWNTGRAQRTMKGAHFPSVSLLFLGRSFRNSGCVGEIFEKGRKIALVSSDSLASMQAHRHGRHSLHHVGLGSVRQELSFNPWYEHSMGRMTNVVAYASSSSSSSSSRSKTLYKCTECGETTLQWSGQCMACKAWGSLEKVTIRASDDGGGGGGGARAAARFVSNKTSKSFDMDGRTSIPSDLVGGNTKRKTWITQDSEVPQRLSDISRRSFTKQWRIRLPGETGQEFNRVLGGGIVPGSLILVGGEPGVGKSTLLLQVSDMISKSHDSQSSSLRKKERTLSSEMNDSREPVESDIVSEKGKRNESHNLEDIEAPILYVSGEESAEQIGSRAERMGLGGNENVYLYSATRLDTILDAILMLKPCALVVDSIQTVYLDDLPSSSGSVVQVRECASALLQVAKREKIPVFLVGHVTKSGDIAGPRVLEHIVDVVVYMEGGRQQPMRLVRCIKNRYGATDEVGVFSMEESGLHAITNPSAMFMSGKNATSSSVSSGVTVIMEGTRPLLMEVQALCSPVSSGNTAPPLRSPTGIRKERLWLLLAVLGKHTNMRPYRVDVHLNVTGGLSISEPAADLAIIAALASSYYEKPIPCDVALLGEVGLGGEIRPVTQLDRRISEAVKLGFKTIIIPCGTDLSGKKKNDYRSCNLIECGSVVEAMEKALGPIPSGYVKKHKRVMETKPYEDGI